MRKRLTAEGVKREAAPPTGQVEIFDNVVPAMALRVTANGARSLVVRARIKGQPNPIRVTIRTIREGDEIDLAEARKAARDVLIKCQNGEDPRKVEEPVEEAPEITLAEAWERYRDVHLRRKERSDATLLVYQGNVALLKDWLKKPLAELTPKMVAERHDRITRENGSYRANGVMRTLRAIYNHARKTARHLPPDNPVGAVDWNKEVRRDTAMAPDELPAWFAQLAQFANPIRREYHLFTLLSGSRPAALREAKVSDLDLKRRVLHVPKPKGGAERAFDIPLSRAMIRCLVRAIRASRTLYPFQARTWIFAGREGHLASQQESRTDLAKYGNDLRQTYRTLGLIAGLSDLNMKLLMNHALPGVSEGYITRAALGDHLHEAQENLSRFVLDAAGQRNGWPFVSSRRCIREAVERAKTAAEEREAA